MKPRKYIINFTGGSFIEFIGYFIGHSLSSSDSFTEYKTTDNKFIHVNKKHVLYIEESIIKEL